eukprot:m.49044 g.49044  ORF g.49044 m.49044 type:complete len:69 (-) comp12442_c1_seq3:121-327(-)
MAHDKNQKGVMLKDLCEQQEQGFEWFSFRFFLVFSFLYCVLLYFFVFFVVFISVCGCPWMSLLRRCCL